MISLWFINTLLKIIDKNEKQIEFVLTEEMKQLVDYENFEENFHIKEKLTLEEKIKKLEEKISEAQKETVKNIMLKRI